MIRLVTHETMFYRVAIFSALVAIAIAATCDPGPVDVMFVLSSDASLTKAEFEKKLQVVSGFVQQVNMGSNGVRVGLITEYDYADLEFHMNDHTDKAELLRAIDFIYFYGGYDHFGSGLEYIHYYGMDNNLGGRPGVPDVIIVLTDGLVADTHVAQNEVDMLTDANVTVIAVGAGNIDHKELVKIASGCHYVHQNPDFSSIRNIVSGTLALTCDAVNCVPYNECECDMVAEVVFLIDGGEDQGKDNFQLQIDFLEDLVEDLNIRANETRVAAVTYSTYFHPQFPLDAHTNKTELALALDFIPFQSGNTSHPELGLDYIREAIFSKARNNAQKIVVITSTGPLSDPAKAEAEALKLKNQGATILSVAIGAQASLQELGPLASGDDYIKQYNDVNHLLTDAAETANLLCNGKAVRNPTCGTP